MRRNETDGLTAEFMKQYNQRQMEEFNDYVGPLVSEINGRGEWYIENYEITVGGINPIALAIGKGAKEYGIFLFHNNTLGGGEPEDEPFVTLSSYEDAEIACGFAKASYTEQMGGKHKKEARKMRRELRIRAKKGRGKLTVLGCKQSAD